MIEIILAIGAIAMFGLIEKIRRMRKGHGISILVPFHCPDQSHQRVKNWHWLKRYWKCHLPGAQIIEGNDWRSLLHPEVPFSKSAAVNNAAKKATGDIFVIVDADGYIAADAVLEAADRIRHARKRGHKLWFVPYRWFYRLTEECSRKLLHSNPCRPHKFSTPPPMCCVQSTDGSQHGHWYGAGIQIMPREAFEEVGGWDERFRGWGGEDHAAMRAMDTLYWRHKTLPVQFLHVWHPMISPEGATDDLVNWRYRVWAGQEASGANDELSGRYYGAHGDPERMRKLVNEGHEFKKKK
jgi:glycosyltransferase involved in cell wall biosynthesis